MQTSEPAIIEFDTEPAPGSSESVLPGMRWVRLPLPFALDHVNCWLLDGERPGETTLIDTGIASDTTRAIWSSLFAKGFPDELLVTHFHPDHLGLASWFVDEGATLYGHPRELALAASIWAVDDATSGERYARWYRDNGLDEEVCAVAASRGNGFRRIVSEPPELAPSGCLSAGDQWRCGERTFDVLEGRGHAPDMLMLHDAANGVLIVADQVLPGITPNVSIMPGTHDPDPLGSFLATLDELSGLPETTLVLPSHGRPFRGLHARLEQLRQHHETRLEQVRVACREPMTAADLFPLLFRRKLDAQQLSFALGESLSHLSWLASRGEITAICTAGRYRYVQG